MFIYVYNNGWLICTKIIKSTHYSIRFNIFYSNSFNDGEFEIEGDVPSTEKESNSRTDIAQTKRTRDELDYPSAKRSRLESVESDDELILI